jgi:para-aminobenzoate synthetase component 1
MPSHALSWRLTPLEAMARWPASVPLGALVSGDESTWSRWSVLAVPGAWQSLPANASREASVAWLRERVRDAGVDAATPFDGAWLLQLGYELGAALEPATNAAARGNDVWPLAQAAPVRVAAVHDAQTGTWMRVGNAPDAWPAIEDAMTRPAHAGSFALDTMQASSTDDDYASLVTRTREYIRAGDLFQANVARLWEGDGHGDVRAFALAALGHSHARYGAWLETPAGCVASMSPELFLHAERNGAVITRPIKGTRPANADTNEFMRSGKDAAELHMIVDLMRNDLSRACEPGSVRVLEARAAEPHATVLHGVAQIHGTLRRDRDLADLIAATFPPGSITGAPKVRAMQVIRELEGFDRGPFYGAIGLLGGDGSLSLNVAIRTATLQRHGTAWRVRYAAGCGIVSDSDPAEEVRETHAKAAVLHRAADALRSATALTR